MNYANPAPTKRTGLLVFSVFLSGCAGAQLKQNVELDSVLASGNYQAAALLAEQRMDLPEATDPALRAPVVYNPKYVLTHLEAAEAWRMAGDIDRSLEHFDAAESALGDVETDVSGNSAKKIGAALINETLTAYVPSPAESVLINYYKALMFWSIGKPDLARVELNRADDRTRRGVERYTKEIADAQKEAEAKKTDQTYANPEVSDQINTNFPEMAQWAPYAEFVVPPATLLQALFLANSDVPSDHEKSMELYQRLLGIVGEQGALRTDFNEVSTSGLCPERDCVWVLVERGQGPELQERRFGYPALTPDGLITVQMALPALVSRFDPSLFDCSIQYANVRTPCEPFASMDKVIQTEFSKRFPGIVTRALVSTVFKAVAQNEANKHGELLGGFAGLITGIVADATTTADIRMWRSMPSDFTLNRVKRGEGPMLSLNIAGQTMDVPLAAKGNELIHVKSPLPYLPPVVTAVTF